MIGPLSIIVFLSIYLFLQRHTIPNRIRDLRDGAIGVIYTPLVFLAIAISGVGAVILSQHIPILQWGWLGHNALHAPVTTGTGGIATGTDGVSWASTLQYTLATLLWILVILLLIFAFILFNYDEENLFRGSWSLVGFWAIYHLIMGIPLFSVIPIFAAGIVFKIIHDRKGLEVAYVTHVATNTTGLIFLVTINTV